MTVCHPTGLCILGVTHLPADRVSPCVTAAWPWHWRPATAPAPWSRPARPPPHLLQRTDRARRPSPRIHTQTQVSTHDIFSHQLSSLFFLNFININWEDVLSKGNLLFYICIYNWRTLEIPIGVGYNYYFSWWTRSRSFVLNTRTSI